MRITLLSLLRLSVFSWVLALLAAAQTAFPAQPAATQPARWWKGNLHTHSLWSDGEDYPEMIVEWYKEQGYQFLALSDHNVLLQGQKWIVATNNRGGDGALRRYVERFGQHWVEQRWIQNTQMVRLKTLAEFRPLFEEANRFLLIPAEEITDHFMTQPIHMNATNLRDLIKPQGGQSVLDVLQRNMNALRSQRRITGRPMILHANHPNFGWAITAEDLMLLQGDRFFEVYNGHPLVHNEGDFDRPGMERMWDIILAFRLTQLNLGVLYGLAVDDSHRYHSFQPTNSNPGRGWVMVRAPQLKPELLIAALEAGNFYSSTGVKLRDVRRGTNSLALTIEAEEGVSYTTQFIGTRVGFDPASEPGVRPAGTIYPVTRRYSEGIGTVLAEVPGASPSYVAKGDEIYVRAKVLSSKIKANAVLLGETEVAWTQPLVLARPRR